MNSKNDIQYEAYIQRYSAIMKSQLKEKETIELFKLYKQTNEKDIKERIIMGNLRFVYRMVWKFCKENKVNISETESYAYEGLINAVNSFDYTKGHPFSTFATNRIKLTLKQAISKEKEQNIETLSDGIKITINDDFVDKIIQKEELENYLSVLKEIERKVIEYRFSLTDGHYHTLEETGKLFNMPTERIRQIEAKAIRKMQREQKTKSQSKNPKSRMAILIQNAIQNQLNNEFKDETNETKGRAK